MNSEKYYQEILESYPEFVTKDQMYRICHISKRTCLFLLESGAVPNIDSGKKTRRFKIKTVDIIEYMRRRQTEPRYYRVPDGYYSKKGKVPISMNHVFTDGEISKIRLFYNGLLSDYPDVMTTLDVSRFTGYHRNSVSLWCSNGHLKCFFIRQQYMVPKEYLIEFLLGDYFYQIITKSAKHKWFINQIRLIVD